MMNAGRSGLRDRKRVVVAVVCAVMVLSLLVSSAYIVHEAACHHRCLGENCPVCQFVAQVEQLCKGFGLVLLVLLLACFAMLARPAAYGRRTVANAAELCTLVGRKIRLND